MALRSTYRWLVGLFIVLFLAAQSLTLSHAANYGDAPHEHDGIACSITVVASDKDIIQPVVPVETKLEAYVFQADYVIAPQAINSSFHSRAPPPRGPPSLF